MTECDRLLNPTQIACDTRRPAYRERMSELIFTDEKDAARYSLHRGKDLVSILDYNDDGTTIALTRAYTIPTFRGSGYAGELVRRVVSDLERRGDRRVIPVCWYVADWFDANPGHESLLKERRTA